MDAKLVNHEARPQMLFGVLTLLSALVGHVQRTVDDLEGVLTAHAKAPAWWTAMAADLRAESDPIKTVAVGFILIGVALVIALTILPVITSAVAAAQSDGNLSTTDGTLLGLLPTLLIVGLIAGGVAFLFQGFKRIRMN